jgi:ribosomal-protein-alanine N-acetyltransferase
MAEETGKPALRIRMMALGDVEAALAVERGAFREGWPTTAFARELTQNGAARYVVLQESATGRMLGFGGLWLMVDEAHIVTVAVEPGERGKGYGRLLVHALVKVATEHGMSVATLECRESNTVARALYRGYGFYEVGLRKKYYSDNHEDAVIMTTEEFGGDAYRARWARLEAEVKDRFRQLAWALGDGAEEALEDAGVRERR